MTTGPTYRNPPVEEVALGVQFAELMGFTSVDFGAYYETIRDRFPVVADQPRLPPMTEEFPKARLALPPHLKLATVSGPQRVWYKDAQDAHRLMQVQPDRFVFNWRKSSPQETYPRYSENARICLSEFEGFLRFCRGQAFSDVRPNMCEVTYVNRIEPLAGEVIADLFAKIFTGSRGRHSTDFLPSPEATRLDRVFAIGEQEGRLYAEAAIAADQQRREFIIFNLTGRVLIPSTIAEPTVLAGVEHALDKAHQWVVRGFECLTDPEMQRERWRKVT